MSLWHLIWREIVFRAGGSLLGVLAVAVAVGTMTGSRTLLGIHDRQERELLDAREAETRGRMESVKRTVRRAMGRLGFNVTILPEGQNLGDWLGEDYAARMMPYEAVEKLRGAGLRTLEKPTAQLRQKLKWPETKWTVILAGTEGRILKDSQEGVVDPVKPGTVWTGHEIHRGQGLRPGAKVTILGKEFRVEKCLDPEASNEDITVWMSLADAQELLGKAGQINEIVGMETRTALGEVEKVREEVRRILPGVQVVERAPQTVTKLQARLKTEEQVRASIERERDTQAGLARERQRVALLLGGLVFLICAVWVGLLAFSNAGERRDEIGIWRALGAGSPRVTALFLGKWCVLAMAGGALGFAGGTGVAAATGSPGEWAGAWLLELSEAGRLGVSLAVAVGLALVASWVPTLGAIRQDPASVISEQ